MAKRLHPQTGPKTSEGKARSSQNSTVHGCRSEQHRILPGEDAATYEALRQRWFNEYGGADANDAALIERLAQAEWRMRRCERKLAEVEEYINANKPLWEWTDADHQLIALANRYLNQSSRFYNNARRDVDNLRLTRQREIKLICEAEFAMNKFVLTSPAPTSQENQSRLGTRQPSAPSRE